MALLLGIAFAAGLVTALSPCVLPVLPVLLAGGAAGGPRRPYAIVAGLVVSFTVFTITAAALLDALGLPQDLLRNAAIALLILAGIRVLAASRDFGADTFALAFAYAAGAAGPMLGIALAGKRAAAVMRGRY